MLVHERHRQNPQGHAAQLAALIGLRVITANGAV